MKPKTIEAYIAAAPKETQAKLRQMRTIIRKAVPNASEGIKWRMPSFSHKRILVMFGAFKDHVSLFPTGSALKGLEKEVAKFRTGRGTLQFSLKKPLPAALIRKITLLRSKELKEKDKKWRSKPKAKRSR